MKFIHLADLHLGKIIYQNNLLDIIKSSDELYGSKKNRYFSNCWRCL